MDNKGRIEGEYQVTLKYRGLSMDELCRLLTLADHEKLHDSHDDLLDPKVGKDYDYYDDGWAESSGTYNITFVVGQCGGIDRDSWLEWSESRAKEDYDDAEKLRQLIKDKTGIE